MTKIPDEEPPRPLPSSNPPTPQNGDNSSWREKYPRKIKPSYRINPQGLKMGKRKKKGKIEPTKAIREKIREWQRQEYKDFFGCLEDNLERKEFITQQVAMVTDYVNLSQEEKEHGTSKIASLEGEVFVESEKKKAALELPQGFDAVATPDQAQERPLLSDEAEFHRISGKQEVPEGLKSLKEFVLGIPKRHGEGRTPARVEKENLEPRLLYRVSSQNKHFEARARDTLVSKAILCRDGRQGNRTYQAVLNDRVHEYWTCYQGYRDFIEDHQFLKRPDNWDQLWELGVVGAFEKDFHERGEAQSMGKVF